MAHSPTMIPVDSLVPHPANPRVRDRDDVIEQMLVQVQQTGFFNPAYAILVRPLPSDSNASLYQIIAGHQRTKMAKLAGLSEIPCWIQDMNDEEAYMALLLSNAQGELDPLEQGFHALQFDVYHGGGATGDLRTYAEALGGEIKNQFPRVSKLRSAAQVASKYPGPLQDLLGKSTHLYEISKTPENVWAVLTEMLIKKGWSYPDSQEYTKKVNEFNLPASPPGWLPADEVFRRYLEEPDSFPSQKKLAPRTVDRLRQHAQEVYDWIDNNGTMVDYHTFQDWLTEKSGEESWDFRAIAGYLAELKAGLEDRVEGWYHGTWEQHLSSLEDESVHLLLCDPPYGKAWHSRWRATHSGAHDEINGDETPQEAAARLEKMLCDFIPKLTDNSQVWIFCAADWELAGLFRDIIIQSGLTIDPHPIIWYKESSPAGMGDLVGQPAPIHEYLWRAVKGSPQLYSRIHDVLAHPRILNSSNHPAEKPVQLLKEIIEATTVPGQIVVDPMAGSGSTCVAAKETGRAWWGTEIELEHWETGQERLK